MVGQGRGEGKAADNLHFNLKVPGWYITQRFWTQLKVASLGKRSVCFRFQKKGLNRTALTVLPF